MSASLVLLAAAFELPSGEEWLRPAERATLLRFRAPKRRRDFRLGRFAVKRALAFLEGGEGAGDLQRFEIRRAPGGAPVAFRDGVPLGVALSISHSEGWAIAAVSHGTDRLGCDLERIEARSRAFLEDYFSAAEQAFVEAGPTDEVARRATLLWSAKEAVMKALGQGLRLPPAAVRVVPDPDRSSSAGWRTFAVQAPPTATNLRGFWRLFGDFVLTVAGGPDRPLLIGPFAEDAPRTDARVDGMDHVP